MIVRDGTGSDIDDAIRLGREAHAARKGLLALSGRTTRMRAAFMKSDSFFVVAEQDGDILGIALGMQGLDEDGAGPPVPGLCHVSTVFVAPDRWGEGIGRELVVAVLAHAVGHGYDRAQLWTQTDNERARRLYEGLGFRPSGRAKDEHGERIVHYHRELDTSIPNRPT